MNINVKKIYKIAIVLSILPSFLFIIGFLKPILSFCGACLVIVILFYSFKSVDKYNKEEYIYRKKALFYNMLNNNNSYIFNWNWWIFSTK